MDFGVLGFKILGFYHPFLPSVLFSPPYFSNSIPFCFYFPFITCSFYI